ncbi:MAG TPA: aminopeptidase [Limnobacter sp.]|nr:aminopeptidase [Limnobacter sp.]
MRVVRRLCVVALWVMLGGCSSTQYLWQATAGHLTILAKARPIDEVIADPEVSDRLKQQLQHVQAIRRFSVDVLQLPDNRSYTQYSDVGRPFVVWNVVVSEPDDLRLQQWCFPFTGCISYKGFYSEADARVEAQRWRAQGKDVAVLGVPAYSTLGFTPDPVLSTFVHYPAGELARLIFHELAHQVVYIGDDTQFNESFASAVEWLGVEAWLREPGRDELAQQYRVFDERRVAFRTLLARARADLIKVYANEALGASDRLAYKKQRLIDLRKEYETLKADWAGWSGYDRFMAEDLNNAKLGVVGLYDDYVPAFKVLFERCGASFPNFYSAVERLGELPAPQRLSVMEVLGHGGASMPVSLCDSMGLNR